VTAAVFELPSWPFSLGAPELHGRIRSTPEDFRVREIPQFEPSGEGNHLWLEVRKRGANTNWVAERLATCAGVPARDVGFAGMKDRHGVTTQWFSVSLQEARNREWRQWAIPDVEFLEVRHHNRKLKRGALQGNRFEIVVRDLEGDRSSLQRRIERVRQNGVPNYFGPQRFGFNGGNVPRGMHWLERGGRLPRNKRSIYISSVRSFLFNDVLARRVEMGNWNGILDGEIAMLHGSHSVFPCAMPDAELERRCGAFDIHPTGPLPGSGGMRPEREAGRIEAAALAGHAAMIDALVKAGASAERRSLRLVPEDLQCELLGDSLRLSFGLAAGHYATSLLRELVTCDSEGHIPES
jgi:tRNA pseudouridine13 synthase